MSFEVSLSFFIFLNEIASKSVIVGEKGELVSDHAWQINITILLLDFFLSFVAFHVSLLALFSKHRILLIQSLKRNLVIYSSIDRPSRSQRLLIHSLGQRKTQRRETEVIPDTYE